MTYLTRKQQAVIRKLTNGERLHHYAAGVTPQKGPKKTWQKWNEHWRLMPSGEDVHEKIVKALLRQNSIESVAERVYSATASGIGLLKEAERGLQGWRIEILPRPELDHDEGHYWDYLDTRWHWVAKAINRRTYRGKLDDVGHYSGFARRLDTIPKMAADQLLADGFTKDQIEYVAPSLEMRELDRQLAREDAERRDQEAAKRATRRRDLRQSWEEDHNPVLLAKVSDLRLSARAANALRSENIIYLGDLVQLMEKDLKNVPNLGKTSINEIKEELASRGLHIGIELPDWPPENIEQLIEAFGFSEPTAQSL